MMRLSRNICQLHYKCFDCAYYDKDYERQQYFCQKQYRLDYGPESSRFCPDFLHYKYLIMNPKKKKEEKEDEDTDE